MAQDPSLNLRFKELREVTGNLANKLNHYLEMPSIESDRKLVRDVSGRLVLQCRQVDPVADYFPVDPEQFMPFDND